MKLKKDYQAIFFDAGGTLFAPHPSVGEVYSRIAKKHGMVVREEEIESLFQKEFSSRDKVVSVSAHSSEKNEKEWWRSLVYDIFHPPSQEAAAVKLRRNAKRVLLRSHAAKDMAKQSHIASERFRPAKRNIWGRGCKAAGLHKTTSVRSFDSFFEELYDLFASAEVWKLYPDVIPVLRVLKKRKYILGIISNWDSRLFSICKGMGVEKYFDVILASAVVGFAKPDTRIFQKALSMTQVEPTDALYVGNSIENDFHGAKRSGMDALIINRDGRQVENVDSIFSLDEIIHPPSQEAAAVKLRRNAKRVLLRSRATLLRSGSAPRSVTFGAAAVKPRGSTGLRQMSDRT